MDNGLMSIGKAAEMSHLSVATLRLYYELGLLKLSNSRDSPMLDKDSPCLTR